MGWRAVALPNQLVECCCGVPRVRRKSSFQKSTFNQVEFSRGDGFQFGKARGNRFSEEWNLAKPQFYSRWRLHVFCSFGEITMSS